MKRQIFSVLGVMPEPGGYAIAKFSRTPTYKSYQDWVAELTQEGAEKFYHAIYFQYGHASIADLAHVMAVLENISVPARNLLLDDQLIDVQSRSTRYVDYSQAVMIVPPEIKKDRLMKKLYLKTCRQMTALYFLVLEKVAAYYRQKYLAAKPQEMTEEDYSRIVRVRAIDVARYLLPCGIPKSMGVIASARTWERIISKFLSADLQELQEIGQDLQKAICQKQALNPSLAKLAKIKWLDEKQKKQIKKLFFGKNVALPTLVKYAQPNEYPKNLFTNLKKWLPKLGLAKIKPDGRRGVELFEKIDPEVDLVTTLFYKVTPHSFGQILNSVKKLPPKTLAKIIEESYQFRGDHDAVFKEAATGNLTFDICMDIGSFRDLHRHRNCIQILKPLNNDYGYDLPKEVAEVGLAKEYEKVLAEVDKAYKQMEKKYPGVGQYLLAQACRRRFLMRMSPWEVQYISELRSRPQGHISYRQISFQMAQLFAQKYPEWGKHFRVTNPQVVDFFKR